MKVNLTTNSKLNTTINASSILRPDNCIDVDQTLYKEGNKVTAWDNQRGMWAQCGGGRLMHDGCIRVRNYDPKSLTIQHENGKIISAPLPSTLVSTSLTQFNTSLGPSSRKREWRVYPILSNFWSTVTMIINRDDNDNFVSVEVEGYVYNLSDLMNNGLFYGYQVSQVRAEFIDQQATSGTYFGAILLTAIKRPSISPNQGYGLGCQLLTSFDRATIVSQEVYVGTNSGTYNALLSEYFYDSFSRVRPIAKGVFVQSTFSWIVLDVPDDQTYLGIAANPYYSDNNFKGVNYSTLPFNHRWTDGILYGGNQHYNVVIGTQYSSGTNYIYMVRDDIPLPNGATPMLESSFNNMPCRFPCILGLPDPQSMSQTLEASNIKCNTDLSYYFETAYYTLSNWNPQNELAESLFLQSSTWANPIQFLPYQPNKSNGSAFDNSYNVVTPLRNVQNLSAYSIRPKSVNSDVKKLIIPRLLMQSVMSPLQSEMQLTDNFSCQSTNGVITELYAGNRLLTNNFEKFFVYKNVIVLYNDYGWSVISLHTSEYPNISPAYIGNNNYQLQNNLLDIYYDSSLDNIINIDYRSKRGLVLPVKVGQTEITDIKSLRYQVEPYVKAFQTSNQSIFPTFGTIYGTTLSSYPYNDYYLIYSTDQLTNYKIVPSRLYTNTPSIYISDAVTNSICKNKEGETYDGSLSNIQGIGMFYYVQDESSVYYKYYQDEAFPYRNQTFKQLSLGQRVLSNIDLSEFTNINYSEGNTKTYSLYGVNYIFTQQSYYRNTQSQGTQYLGSMIGLTQECQSDNLIFLLQNTEKIIYTIDGSGQKDKFLDLGRWQNVQNVHSLCYSPVNDYLYILIGPGTSNQTIIIVDIKSGNATRFIDLPPYNEYTSWEWRQCKYGAYLSQSEDYRSFSSYQYGPSYRFLIETGKIGLDLTKDIELNKSSMRFTSLPGSIDITTSAGREDQINQKHDTIITKQNHPAFHVDFNDQTGEWVSYRISQSSPTKLQYIDLDINENKGNITTPKMVSKDLY